MAKATPGSDSLKLIQLQLVLIEHCKALRRVTDHLRKGHGRAAVRELDATTSVVESAVRDEYRRELALQRRKSRKGAKTR